MSQWVRLWEDMPTDPKWRVIARRSGRPVSEVIAVFVFMMTNASGAKERGALSSWDDESVAIALDMEESSVGAIREAMQGKVLNGDALMGWEKRQPKREDASTDRVNAFRDRQAAMKRDETHGNERQNNETQRNAPEEKREDTEKKVREEANASLRVKAQEFYDAYPKHVDPKASSSKFISVCRSGVDPDRIIAAARRLTEAHRIAGTDKKYIAAPAVWLNKGGYDSEDLPAPPRAGPIPFPAKLSNTAATQRTLMDIASGKSSANSSFDREDPYSDGRTINAVAVEMPERDGIDRGGEIRDFQRGRAIG